MDLITSAWRAPALAEGCWQAAVEGRLCHERSLVDLKQSSPAANPGLPSCFMAASPAPGHERCPSADLWVRDALFVCLGFIGFCGEEGTGS